jgi:hypothetical protein
VRPFASFYAFFGGVRYRFRFVRSSEIPYDRWADCSDPTDPKREIRVRQVLRGRARLETVIHEALHAQTWSRSEEDVRRSARELAALLWRLGYREVQP